MQTLSVQRTQTRLLGIGIGEKALETDIRSLIERIEKKGVVRNA